MDPDHGKKQRPEYNQHADTTDSIAYTSKRARERTSPTISSPVEAEKKRYRNNDILSSLSSSISMGIKRTASALSESTPVARSRSDEAKENAVRALINDHAHLTNSIVDTTSADAIRRIGKSNSDIPPYQTSKPPEQVLKSMSDSSVANHDGRKPPKLTLFNKAYKPNETTCEGSDEEDQNDVSYVKPKARTSKLFTLIKGRDPAKSKLSMMLGFLRGQESTDEVDTVQTKEVAKSQIEVRPITAAEVKTTVASKAETESKENTTSPAQSLATGTKVTFSTATTTSPTSNTLSPVIVTPKKDSVVAPVTTAPDTSKNLISFTPASTASTTLVSNKTDSPKFQLAASSPSVSSSSSIVATAPTTVAATTSPQRVGGFAFGATPAVSSAAASPATQSIALPASASLATTAFGATSPLIASSARSPLLASATTFGTKATDSVQAKPPPPAYGASTGSPSTPFSFGKSVSPAKPASSAVPTFGSAASTAAPTFGTVTSTSAPTPATAQAATFGFGAPSTSATPAASNSAAPSFVFGASNVSKPTPAFGSPTAIAAPSFGAAASSTTPSFGAVASSTTPSFAAAASSTTPSFAAAAASKPFAFGGAQTNSGMIRAFLA